MHLSEKMRLSLVNWLFTTLYGLRLGEVLRLLRRHHFAVDLAYIPRMGLMLLGGVLTSLFARYEALRYGRQIAQTTVEAPIFILGHWRSGTTFLHNLMVVDEQFASPNLWQVLNPHTFLTTERFAGIVKHVSPKDRMMDSVDLSVDAPFEDEFATCGTLCSPFLSWVFPRDAKQYDKYLTFAEATPEELSRWKGSLLRFFQKVTWKYDRTLLLKSPPHTCRIKILLDLFPDARFIHIYRDPFDVFRSSKRQIEVSFLTNTLQQARPEDLDSWIITRYRMMYDAYFAERDLIPPGQFCEVRFEDLEIDPVGEVAKIYAGLGLPDFAQMQPALEGYVASLGEYRKNAHRPLPTPLRSTILSAWARCFEAWGYGQSLTMKEQ
ncbi:sulfotransferase [Chloroflexia bacterium SDU3-3]|nr:sulfotransferase [Chloroflexia bacterium SDU3-3]